jgi:ribosomal protein S18 acetylase RimI-like enzyme
MPLHFERVVRLAEMIGEVWRTEDFDAVACWLAPGRWPPTDDELRTSGVARTPQLIGDEAWARFKVVYEAMDEAHERAVAGPHWDLWVVGVEPAARGRGLGTSLLTPMLARLDQAAETCYLETLDARTLHLYERMGFDVVLEKVEPTSGLRFWCCVRQPAP